MTPSASTNPGHAWVSTPDGLHARGTCSRNIDFGMVAYKDSPSRVGVESLQGTLKDPAIRLAHTLGIGNQHGVEQG